MNAELSKHIEALADLVGFDIEGGGGAWYAEPVGINAESSPELPFRLAAMFRAYMDWRG